jgi:hypothetical protein
VHLTEEEDGDIEVMEDAEAEDGEEEEEDETLSSKIS